MGLGRVIQRQFRMKECAILGVQTNSDPYYIFSVGQNLPHLP